MRALTRRHVLTSLALLSVGRVMGNSGPRLRADGDQFRLDGRALQIRSGEMHYPRVPRGCWRERFRQARALGLNTISTYSFWSQHEATPGQWDFAAQNDLRAYLTTAAEEGLYVILRPGPYVCAEVDFGGLPAWLLRTPGLRVRSLDPRFLAATREYLKQVATQVAGLSIERGGPLLMVQFENEYGSFGQDKDYLRALLGLYRDADFGVPLYTADGGDEALFEGGTLEDLPAVVNFGGDVTEARDSFAALADWRPRGPRMAGEYWAGWFDHWGEQHHRQPEGEAAATVEWMMQRGFSFNLYMFHGGTSFGWLPGANASALEPYQPDTTSYDYDAPVDEAGRITPKYRQLRAVIERHLPPNERIPPVPADPLTQAVPVFALAAVADWSQLVASAGEPQRSHRPHPMEFYGHSYGFIVYGSVMATDFHGVVSFGEVRDEAEVLLDGQPIGSLSRRLGQKTLVCQWRAGQRLEVLVENTGRIGFGAKFPEERKGLIGDVRAGDETLHDWSVSALSLPPKVHGSPVPTPVGPAVWHGTFSIERTHATFLDTRGWGRGHVWVNGHALGRFWSIGPQQSLYVPAEWLHKGDNEVRLFSTTPPAHALLSGSAQPIYSSLAAS